jgi:hypothetical protein
MSQFTKNTFDEVVSRYFEPMAREHGWQIIRRNDNTYEIPSEYCVMVIDWHQGRHTRSLNVTLIPSEKDSNHLKKIGVWPIAGYNGAPFKYIPWEQTAEGFFQEAEYIAKLAKQYCIPYLLGLKSDWKKVEDHWAIESEKEREKIKSYKFPPQVQKRWHLPPPEFPDSHLPTKPDK